VARGTQHRKRRPPANAAVTLAAAKRKRKPKPPAWQEQLFFSRLKVHAKWVFVLLAFVFGIGFVVFGVGSGSTGISSAMQNLFNSSSSGGASISSLQKKTAANPKNAKAWRDIATTYEQKKRPDDAISALVQYSTLKPKDANALQELAGLYLSRAQAYQGSYSLDQAKSGVLAPTSVLRPSSGSKLGQAISGIQNPISSAVSTDTSTQTNSDYSKLLGYLSDRLGVYQKLAAFNPKDATTQFSLAQAAQTTGDTKTAIVAYRAFLRLAPQDSLAPTVRRTLKQLDPAK